MGGPGSDFIPARPRRGAQDTLTTSTSVSVTETTASVSARRRGDASTATPRQRATRPPDCPAPLSAEELRLSPQLGRYRHYAIFVGGAGRSTSPVAHSPLPANPNRTWPALPS